MLTSQEHYALMEQFERDCAVRGERAMKEPKEMWRSGVVYCHGETNTLFIAYRLGYSYGKAAWRGDDPEPYEADGVTAQLEKVNAPNACHPG